MIPATVPAFDRHYSDAQREAVMYQRIDRDKPFRAIAEQARAGELTTQQGDKLEPFVMPETTMRSLARRALDKRRGTVSNAIADLPHRDAIEQLRRRAVTLAHYALETEEKRKAPDLERQRQVGRLLLELAKLPGPTDPRAPSRGTRDAEGKTGPKTTGGLAGALLKDHRNGGGEPAASDTALHHAERDADDGAHALPPTQTEQHTDALPGAQASERVAQLLG